MLEVVKTLLWTGQLAGERPASAIICAPIGSGKTSVLEKINTDVAIFLSDFTSQHAREILRNEKITHIMIGDLLSVLGHKHGTVKLSLNLLARMSGDHVNRDPWTGDPLPNRKIGVITAIPPEELYSKKMYPILFSGGFASRYIIVQYEYTKPTIRRIHEYIKSDAYTRTTPHELRIDRGEIEVEIPKEIADKIDLLAAAIKQDPIGARAHHQLRALVKARARMRKSNVATDQDFETIHRISDFFTKGGRSI